VQGEIYRGRHTDRPGGRHHSIRLTDAHLHHPPKFFYGPDALPGAQTTVSKRQLIYHNYNCSTDKIQAIALFTATKILWQWQCKDTNYNQCLMYLDLPTSLWPPCVADADIIFLSCFFLLGFISSPNLSGRRLDVYHTSTHSVVLVQI